jgi:hypothetical protein
MRHSRFREQAADSAGAQHVSHTLADDAETVGDRLLGFRWTIQAVVAAHHITRTGRERGKVFHGQSSQAENERVIVVLSCCPPTPLGHDSGSHFGSAGRPGRTGSAGLPGLVTGGAAHAPAFPVCRANKGTPALFAREYPSLARLADLLDVSCLVLRIASSSFQRATACAVASLPRRTETSRPSARAWAFHATRRRPCASQRARLAQCRSARGLMVAHTSRLP